MTTPVPPEKLAARAAAFSELAAAAEARRIAEARETTAQAALDATHREIGSHLEDGDIFVLIPFTVPAIRKEPGKEPEYGVLHSLSPNAPPFPNQ